MADDFENRSAAYFCTRGAGNAKSFRQRAAMGAVLNDLVAAEAIERW